MKYSSSTVQVPWRRPFLSTLKSIDKFIFEYLFRLDRQLHYSQPLRNYRNTNGHCWTIAPHHLLFPSFVLSFHAEDQGVHKEMQVDLDELFFPAATALFYIPLVREFILGIGGRKASPTVLERMRVFGIAPGGIHEMIRQEPNVDKIYLRKGFLRFAYKKKLDVIPIYMFDENEIYKPINPPFEFLTTFKRFVHRRFSLGIPFWKGRWNIPFNPIPYPVQYLCGTGFPIKYNIELESMNEEDAVNRLLELYIEEVKRLFEELKFVTGRRKGVRLEIEIIEARKDRKKGNIDKIKKT